MEILYTDSSLPAILHSLKEVLFNEKTIKYTLELTEGAYCSRVSGKTLP